MSEGRRSDEQHAPADAEQEALASGGDFGRGDRSGHVEGFDPEDHGGNYDPSFGNSPRAFARYSGDEEQPAYGGGGREDYGGGEAGRGADEDAAQPSPQPAGSTGGGTSGASSAIGDGAERRAASGASGSVSGKPTAAGGSAQGNTGSEGSGAMGNASGPNRTDTAPPTGTSR